ncbi:uncharacterized protein LOC126572500 [Anopheles aquasalis]|uniref:uncharacterized protein LOC126572500 n=1 Tax=Anopheles aquasalis TaxID=42839 RepID=UPI00215B3A25|nr:uncharacterized protein LOC126572500 [Anopheles aquasalis]
MMLTVSFLPLVVLLTEQAQRVFAGPSDIAGRMPNETGWARTGFVAARTGLLREDERFYTLEYATTTVRPKRQAHRASKLAREPRFISFQTRDSSIEVEMNFAIPFMSIPVRKSMNGVMDSVLKGTPLVNVNIGAVAVAGVLTLGGALIGAAARTFSNGTQSFWPTMLTAGGWRQAGQRAAESEQQDKANSDGRRRSVEEEHFVWTLLGSLDRTMEQYDIDTVACVQRIVCWYVREATVAVAEGRASKLELAVEGLSRADWLDSLTISTAIQRAVQVGRQQTSCEKTFNNCAIASFVQQAVRLARKRKD